MATIPSKVKELMIIPALKHKLVSQGKVRDTYQVPIQSNALVTVATDRISIFDFVLPALIPRKGQVLTALTHFWFSQVLKDLPSHLKPSLVQPGRNYAFDLKEIYPELVLERSLVLYKLDIIPYELIFRAHLGGSVWKSYQKTGMVAGLEMPLGLVKWEKLDQPLFTPSTKASVGHDVNISQSEYFSKTGKTGKDACRICLEAFKRAYDYAFKRGILILDTKFEVGFDGESCFLADELLTPDSSRFTSVTDLSRAIIDKRDPEFFDKEPVRQWGKTVETPFYDESQNMIVGLNNLDPADPKHLTFVSNLTVPDKIIQQAHDRYLVIFERLTGLDLDAYQKKYLL